jgi:hypothetical protein
MSIDYDIDEENLNLPFQPYIYTDLFQISPSIYRILKKEITMIQFYSSDDLINDNEKYYQGYKFANTVESFDFRKEGLFPGAFSQINIQATNTVSIYRRKYNKLQEIVPKIGGVTQTLTFICWVIVSFFTTNYNRSKIIMNTFDNNEINTYFPKLNIDKDVSKTNQEKEDYYKKNYEKNKNNEEEEGNNYIIRVNNNAKLPLKKLTPKLIHSKSKESIIKKEKDIFERIQINKEEKIIINESNDIINLKDNENNFSFKKNDNNNFPSNDILVLPSYKLKSAREKNQMKSININNKQNNEENSIDNFVQEMKELNKDKDNKNCNDNSKSIKVDNHEENLNIDNNNINKEKKE